MPANPYTVRGNVSFTVLGFNANGPKSDEECFTYHAPRIARAWRESVTVLRDGKPIGTVTQGGTYSTSIFADERRRCHES